MDVFQKHTTLSKCWWMLASVSRVMFEAYFPMEPKKYREGGGRVVVNKRSPSSFLFDEEGKWALVEGKEFRFTNRLEWVLRKEKGQIDLIHLRQGPFHPIFLVSMCPCSRNTLISLKPHFCGKDLYFGKIELLSNALLLTWRVARKKKKEVIRTYYS